jgi:hypothetical protein
MQPATGISFIGFGRQARTCGCDRTLTKQIAAGRLDACGVFVLRPSANP